MKRLFSCIVLAVCFAASISAQKDLVGRVYHHPDIMAGEMKNIQKELSSDIDADIKKEVAEAEKKKGRKLTAEEKAELKKETEEAQKQAQAILYGMKVAVTVTFKSEKDMAMQTKMKVDDEALKKAGIGWAKRNALKAAIAVMPSTEKMQYIVKGNLVIYGEGKDRDTLTLSSDGKYLYGKLDKSTNFKLTRTK